MYDGCLVAGERTTLKISGFHAGTSWNSSAFSGFFLPVQAILCISPSRALGGLVSFPRSFTKIKFNSLDIHAKPIYTRNARFWKVFDWNTRQYAWEHNLASARDYYLWWTEKRKFDVKRVDMSKITIERTSKSSGEELTLETSGSNLHAPVILPLSARSANQIFVTLVQLLAFCCLGQKWPVVQSPLAFYWP